MSSLVGKNKFEKLRVVQKDHLELSRTSYYLWDSVPSRGFLL